jgi:hypothetical protein
MPKRVMDRKAAQNRYFHPDFHGALSGGIEYLETRFGPEAVREYLHRFTAAFYAPLKEQVRQRGLAALKEHFEALYGQEGGKWSVESAGDELVLRVEECPAVSHMRGRGYPVARLFYETSKTVHAAICEGTPVEHEWLEYDPATGARVERFRRRP